MLQAIDLFDRVTCERGAGRSRFAATCRACRPIARISSGRPRSCCGRRRAATASRATCVVTLEKKIPMQAGLGGGSSDAAAALLGLRRLWKLRVPDEQVHAIAARLGSDVPFFLVGGTALGLGRGEEVYPLDESAAVLGRAGDPAVRRCHAGRVSRGSMSAEKGSGAFSSASPKNAPDPFFRTCPLVNDLEAPVIERHPVIGELKQRLAERGALMAAMSGSGSTVFGVFASARAAARSSAGAATTVHGLTRGF